MPCSNCKQPGHNRRTCVKEKSPKKKQESLNKKKSPKTEDTGKEWEKAICIAGNTPYDGNFKYSNENAEKLAERIKQFIEERYEKVKHTARGGAEFDFEVKSKQEENLSAKSTKGRANSGKVAPHKIGQPSIKKFCEKFSIEEVSNESVKQYIKTNPHIVLECMLTNTFKCPILYFVKGDNTIRFIKLIKPIDWTKFEFSWTNDWTTTGGTTLKLKEKNISIVEFQIHNTRKNMALRWYFEKLLIEFSDHFEIVSI